MATPDEIRAAIRRIFVARGIDPTIAERVIQAESSLNPAAVGDRGRSFGLAQLYTGGGLGNVAMKRGIDPRDPNQWERHLEFMAEQVASNKQGWGPWHAAKRIGVGPREGIGGVSPASVSTPLPTATAAAAAPALNIRDLSGLARYNRGKMGQVGGLVLHHTGGHGTAEGVINTLNQRGLGVHYVMDREGNVYRGLPQGARGAHIKPSERKEIPISNANALGIEVIAKDDSDITPAQKAAIRGFRDYAAQTYGFDPKNVYGHGHINSHKQATEGATLLAALNGAPQPATGMVASGAPSPAAPAADPGIPNVATIPATGLIGQTSDPWETMLADREKEQQAQQLAQAAQAKVAPPPPAAAPPPPEPAAPPVDYSALLMPRLRRGLLADTGYGMLG